MTDVHVLRRGGVGDTRDEQARRAVKVFRDFQPTLTSYARALTGRSDVRVEMHSSSNGMTDGKIIYYRPPIELGDNTPHVRRLCNKREQLQLLCKACRMREKVLVVIYHEINHIAEGTFAPTTERAKADAIKRAVEENGTKYAKQIENAVRNAPRHVADSYLGLAGIISPFLPVLVNALEDARVNTRGFQKRRGTRIMFNADTQSIFAEGVEQKDPATGEITKIMWKDYPLNSQVSVGVFCKASGYDYENWFAPVVKQALDDPTLTDLISQIENADGPEDSFELSFPILARLRELGFCKSDKDPEDEEQDESDGDSPSVSSSGEEQSEGEGGSSSDPVRPDSTDESGADDEDSARDESESGDGDDQQHGSVAGSEDEAEEEGPDGGDGSSGSGSEDGTDEDAGNDSAAPDGSEESESTDADNSDGQAEQDAADGEPEHGDGSAGADEGGPSEEQELGSSSTGEGSEAVDANTDGGRASEGQAEDESDSADSPREGSGEVSSDSQEGVSPEVPSSDSSGSDGLDEAGDREASGRPERDDGVEHSEDLPGVDDMGDDAEQDGEADSPLQRVGDEEAEESLEPTPIDTGADEGLGGVKLTIPDDAEMGDADDAMEGLLKVEQHEDRPTTAEMRKNDEAMEVAVIQGLYFETPSTNIRGVRENRYGVKADGRSNSWEQAERYAGMDRIIRGIDGDFDPAEDILGPALLHMRVVFADNQRGKNTIHLKSGRVNAKVLGKRAPVHDPRLFKKRTQPGKKDYFVVIGVDISGSTIGENLVLTKRAVMAQATLLSRMGIKFAIYAHSGTISPGSRHDMDLDIYIVKEAEEPWSEPVKDRLRKLSAYIVNLDGHALEYLRKVADRSNATDKIILYYSDGKMPAENAEEELVILQREIKMCAKKGYTLLGVGIRTDSPARHGLDTVQVDDNSDLVKVVRHIEKRLLAQ